MNVRQNLLRAADHITANPQQFDFSEGAVPGRADRGCAIGWAAYFAGVRQGRNVHRRPALAAVGVGVENEVLGFYDAALFYNRMDKFDREDDVRYQQGWRRNPQRAAELLRRYADCYHPDETKPVKRGLPQSILNIFRRKKEVETA
jgi:hypothetical protein